MSISATPAPAPDWLRGLADARAAYQELLGWPVSVQVGQRNLVVEVGHVLDAVSLPAVLGAGVRDQLRESIPVLPTIANSGGTWWTFLVHPAGFLAGELPAPPIRLAPAGSYVVIPAGLDEPASGWIEAPVPNRPLPKPADIVAAVRGLTT